MKPYALGPEQGEAIWMFDSLDTTKAGAEWTGGGFSVVEFLNFEGSSVPLHANDRWDTGFYIVDGEYSFVITDETVAASPRTWIFVPRGTPHAWRCDSREGRLLNLTVPGGFEGFYREAGESVPNRTRLPARSEPDVEALSSTASRYGIRIVGPPPGK
jgi:mannose-6-phosphate isomerase-like protein (cupin superfamily)